MHDRHCNVIFVITLNFANEPFEAIDFALLDSRH